ncbi:MAG TPA: hypothetical protein VNY25_07485 [Steroidobacteraceae bacterium]|nr:hypothetical protein [Steroidobacteraceae bacterium]
MPDTLELPGRVTHEVKRQRAPISSIGHLVFHVLRLDRLLAQATLCA